MNAPEVNPRLTRKRPKRFTHNPEFFAMVDRMIVAAGRRVGTGDVEDLQELAELSRTLDAVLQQAVLDVRESSGCSWAAVGRAFGMTKQAAQQRWGRLPSA